MNYNLIHTELNTRVGFKDAFNPRTYPSLHPDLLVTDSGLTVNSLSEVFLNIEKITDNLEYYDGMDILDYVLTDTYGLGEKVKFTFANGKKYTFVSKQDGNLGNPYTDNLWWESAVSAKLREYKEDAIKEMVAEFYRDNQINNYVKRLVDNSTLYSRNSTDAPMAKSDRFIALQVIPHYTNNIKVKIDQIGLKYDQIEELTFRLYHSSQPNMQLDSFAVDIAAGDVGNFVWKNLRNGSGNVLELNTYSNLHDYGGRFYLGIFESEMTGSLSGHPRVDYYNLSCTPCKQTYDYRLWETYRGFFKMTPIQSNNLNGVNLPNLGESFDLLTNLERIPFNFRYTITGDPTNHIVQNKELFDTAIQHKIALKLLMDMQATPRLNSNTSEVQEILFLINGGDKSKGLRHAYDRCLKQISIDFEDLDTLFMNYNYPISKAV